MAKTEVRTRKWFLTIHENAESFYKFDDIIKQQERCSYAYIYHNPDDTDNCRHIHVCLDYTNPRSWTTIFNTYLGAHIEPCKYWNKALRYLLHLDNPEKEQYQIEDVISTYDIEQFTMLVNTDEYEWLSTENVLADVKAGLSMFEFVEKYGLHQVNTKHNLISKLLVESENVRRLEGKILYLEKELRETKQRYLEIEDMYGFHFDSKKEGLL